MAVTTSLTVTPNASFTILMSARATSVKATDRRAVIVALNKVRGAVNGMAPGWTPSLPSETPKGGRQSQHGGRHQSGHFERFAQPGYEATAEQFKGTRRGGDAPGTKRGSGGRGQGLRSRRCPIMLAPETPSMVE